MIPEDSPPYSADPATGPYPEPDGSSPHLPTLFPDYLFSLDLRYTSPTHLLLLSVGLPYRDS
jgi:hypothetical protein